MMQLLGLLLILIHQIARIAADEAVLFEAHSPGGNSANLTKCDLLRSLNLAIKLDLDGHEDYQTAEFRNTSGGLPPPKRELWWKLGGGSSGDGSEYFAEAPTEHLCSPPSAAGAKVCFAKYGHDQIPSQYWGDGENWEIIECILTGSWLRARAAGCIPRTGKGGGAAAGRPDVIAVPTMTSLRVAPKGLSVCKPALCGGMWCYDSQDASEEPHLRYWRYLRRRYRSKHAGDPSEPPPLLLLHFDGTWDTPFGQAMVRALAAQPAPFVERVVIASQEDPMQWPLELRAHFRGTGARPHTVVVPYTLGVTATAGPVAAAPSSGRAAEAEAAAAAETEAEAARRPIAVLFSGRPYTGIDATRRRLYDQLVAAGAVCAHNPGAVFESLSTTTMTCALCAGSSHSERAACKREPVEIPKNAPHFFFGSSALHLRHSFGPGPHSACKSAPQQFHGTQVPGPVQEAPLRRRAGVRAHDAEHLLRRRHQRHHDPDPL